MTVFWAMRVHVSRSCSLPFFKPFLEVVVFDLLFYFLQPATRHTFSEQRRIFRAAHADGTFLRCSSESRPRAGLAQLQPA